MKALLLAFALALTTSFAQSVSDAEKAKWQTSEYQEVISLAKQIASKVHDHDFRGAAEMSTFESSVPVASRQRDIETVYKDRYSFVKPSGDAEVSDVTRRTDSRYPDNFIFYDVCLKYPSAEKTEGVCDNVTIVRKDGDLLIRNWR